MKKALTVAVAALFLAAMTAAFLGVRELAFAAKLQLLPAALKLSWGLIVVIAVTWLFGRVFCRVMCPLGMLQSVVAWVRHPKTAVRRVCTRLPETRAQQAVRWSVVAFMVVCYVLGLGAWMGILDPYAIYGRVLSLISACDGESLAPETAFAAVSAAVFAAILVLAALGKGRIWCNWLCPAGTLFNLASRFSWRKDVVAQGCGNCRRCFTGGEAKAPQIPSVTRRDAIKSLAVAVAAEKLTDGDYAPVSLPGRPERAVSVLPPGTGKRGDFFRSCISCQLCVKNCPQHCLSPSVDLRTFGQPEMDFRRGHCLLPCTRCGEVCPTGAIRLLDKAEKATTHMGRAVWSRDLCIRTTGNVECTACERKCPVRAIHIVDGIPVVDAVTCIGCGACEHVCPARPQPAMAVSGLEVQSSTKPIAKADLIDEMRRLVRLGDSVVLARGGVITRREGGAGIAPELRLLDGWEYKGATVVADIVGRAAAAIFVAGGAREVYAKVLSEGAEDFMKRHGVVCAGEERVEFIANRKSTGMCPMEASVL